MSRLKPTKKTSATQPLGFIFIRFQARDAPHRVDPPKKRTTSSVNGRWFSPAADETPKTAKPNLRPKLNRCFRTGLFEYLPSIHSCCDRNAFAPRSTDN